MLYTLAVHILDLFILKISRPKMTQIELKTNQRILPPYCQGDISLMVMININGGKTTPSRVQFVVV